MREGWGGRRIDRDEAKGSWSRHLGCWRGTTAMSDPNEVSHLHSCPLLADNVRVVFVELPIFIRCAAGLFSDEDIAELQNTLLKNPAAGDLIPGGRGLRKLRVPLPGQGKRGGARVIYYHWAGKEQCYLIYAYAKNVATHLTPSQLQRLAEVMQAEIRDE